MGRVPDQATRMRRLFSTAAIGLLLSCASTPPAPPPSKRPPPDYAPHVTKALAHEAQMDRRYPQYPPEGSGSLEQDLEMLCELPDAQVYGDGAADERAEALATYWDGWCAQRRAERCLSSLLKAASPMGCSLTFMASRGNVPWQVLGRWFLA